MSERRAARPSNGGGSNLGQIVIVVVGAAICLVAIAFEPPEGRSLIDAAAMLFSYVALIDVARRGYSGVQRSAGGSRSVWERAVDLARRRPRTTAVSLAALVAALTFLTWYYTSASAKVITADVTAARAADDEGGAHDVGPTGLTDCYVTGERDEGGTTDACVPVTLTIPGTPPDRDYVRLVLDLRNESDTGSCVAPADIVLTPVVDGVPHDSVTGSAGRPVDVPIGGATRHVDVRAEIDQRHDDTACRVSMTVRRAVLHD